MRFKLYSWFALCTRVQEGCKYIGMHPAPAGGETYKHSHDNWTSNQKAD